MVQRTVEIKVWTDLTYSEAMKFIVRLIKELRDLSDGVPTGKRSPSRVSEGEGLV